MLSYKISDITTVDRGMILHGVNCRGAFGAGVAKTIRQKWPIVYHVFKQCPTGKQMLGAFVSIRVNDDLVVGNCYTQLNYGNDGKVYASRDAIRQSLTTALKYARDNNIDDVYMPKIGSKLGGLSWTQDVEPIILELSQQFDDINLNIYYIKE